MEEYKPHPQTIRIPHCMVPKIKARWMDQEYNSVSDYFIGLALYDLMCKCPHKVTAELMRKPQYVRDIIIREICEAFDSKEPKPIRWIKNRLLELAKTLPEDGDSSQDPA